jgi:hypothetical protein
LTADANADIMSDMKTYTVRDLDREPGAVLDACDAEGSVLIRRRDGRTYSLRPERPAQRRAVFPDFLARQRAMGMPKISKRNAAAVDKLLRGE